ncbi:hypothetical protein [Mariniradius sediminis]|uniref:Lipoprotein n=1 Tax=Mariniradius sediminis TaxID=2909237 RepID=A0ABS9BZ59_9BACT|nr:hypothetical protein [Mariniradius sediminis]MCF1753358.1 hypothetical protein [Mariniradius sediminis]
MKRISTFLIGLFLFGCNSTTRTENNEAGTVSTNEKKSEQSVDIDFDNFKIRKGQLGEIKIGMTITEAEKQFTGLKKKTDEATNFGFGGGSPAYLYYLGDELLFGLIPRLETDTLLLIIAAHKNLLTTNGLNPNSTVEDLIEKYPDLTVNQDLMSGGEFFQDKTNNWAFVFRTNKQTEIGDYPELEVPSKPKQLTTHTDWIVIR